MESNSFSFFLLSHPSTRCYTSFYSSYNSIDCWPPKFPSFCFPQNETFPLFWVNLDSPCYKWLCFSHLHYCLRLSNSNLEIKNSYPKPLKQRAHLWWFTKARSKGVWNTAQSAKQMKTWYLCGSCTFKANILLKKDTRRVSETGKFWVQQEMRILVGFIKTHTWSNTKAVIKIFC